MNLGQLRTEVLAHGFDPIQYGSRTTTYLNDAYTNICRRVNFFGSEDTLDFTTAIGTTTYPQPTDLARIHSLRRTDVSRELVQVDLRAIDRSSNVTGSPSYYAMDGFLLHLWPAPDAAYPLELRYWNIPADMVGDADVPSALPQDYHTLLCYWALKECYAGDDDVPTAQYWEGQYDKGVQALAADMKFPSDDLTHQLSSMWEQDAVLASGGGTGGLGSTSHTWDGGSP